jgi:hypothetical protein
MIWHMVLLDTENADASSRIELRRAVQALADIDDVLWFRVDFDGPPPPL